jgi:hypothetical protein
MAKIIAGQPHFRNRRLPSYPTGLFVKVCMMSGKEIEAQITSIETTGLGTFLHVESGDEAANVTAKQIIGFYDFCFLKAKGGSNMCRNE